MFLWEVGFCSQLHAQWVVELLLLGHMPWLLADCQRRVAHVWQGVGAQQLGHQAYSVVCSGLCWPPTGVMDAGAVHCCWHAAVLLALPGY